MSAIADLQAEIARLKGRLEKKNTLTLKVSTKGAVSLYGLGRWPVTLYKGQFQRLLEHAPQITAFIEANDPLLHSKED